MKHKLLFTALAVTLALFSGAVLSAQTRELDFSNLAEFNGIEVSDDFEVTVVPSNFYSAKVTVDDVLSGFVMVYVKQKTLYVNVDERKIPSHVKKLYKGRNASKAVYRAVVQVPTLEALTIRDNAIVSTNEAFKSKTFALKTTDSGLLKGINIEAPTVTLDMEKKSSASVTVSACDALTVTTAGTSLLKLSHTSKDLQLNAKGSSEIESAGDCITLGVTSGNASKVNATGTAKALNIDAAGSCNVDLSGVEAEEAQVIINNSAKVNQAASQKISIDVTGGTLKISGSPVIDLVGVKNGTIERKDLNAK